MAKKTAGFTFVEIIVSISILTIIGVFFLGVMVNHLKILNRTKEITEEMFLVQRELEEEIYSINQEIQDINDGITPTDPRPISKKTIFASDLGGVEVSYYEAEKSLHGRQYFTLVSNVKAEPLEKIKLDSIDAKLKHNDIAVEYGYASSDFVVVGEFNNLEEYKYDHLLNQVEWFVSNERFNMPMPKSAGFDMNDDLEYNSYYFPVFPNDYKLIDNETIYKFGYSYTTFDKLEEYEGRYIVFTVTPAAKSGKLGEQMASDPIFVSGLSATDDLIMHFDASYIDVTIADEVEEIGEDWYLSKWYDISSIIGHTAPNEYAQYAYLKPLVKRNEIGVGYAGQYVSFSEDQKMEIFQNTYGNLTVISVVRNRSESWETEYFKNEDIALKIGAKTDEMGDNWRIEHDVIPVNDNKFELGGNNTDIAEIIVYEGLLSESEKLEIEEYLANKYIDVIVIGDISVLQDMSAEIQIGDSFELPDMVSAEMTTGIYKDVCVTWSGTLNTNIEGTYVMTGTALADSNKTMEYTIQVVSP